VNLDCLKVEISAENREQADTIINALLGRRLVTGGQFLESPARFLWQGEIVDMGYVTTTSFTLEQHREEIVRVVKDNSVEDVPMIAFFAFTPNRELADWIKSTVC
jgi:uncharacterized protein involved in tolerance to divalent cations